MLRERRRLHQLVPTGLNTRGCTGRGDRAEENKFKPNKHHRRAHEAGQLFIKFFIAGWPTLPATITLSGGAAAGFVFGTAGGSIYRDTHPRYSSRTFAGHRSPWRVAVHRVTAWGE